MEQRLALLPLLLEFLFDFSHPDDPTRTHGLPSQPTSTLWSTGVYHTHTHTCEVLYSMCTYTPVYSIQPWRSTGAPDCPPGLDSEIFSDTLAGLSETLGAHESSRQASRARLTHLNSRLLIGHPDRTGRGPTHPKLLRQACPDGTESWLHQTSLPARGYIWG